MISMSRAVVAGALLGLLVGAPGCEKHRLSERLHERARLAIAEGRLADADQTLERALDYDPNDLRALERLIELRLANDRPYDATRLLPRIPERSTRSVALDNHLVRLKLRAALEPLEEVALEAARLTQAGRLHADTERELLDAILAHVVASSRDGREPQTALLANAALPEPWFVTVVERLLAARDWHRASAAIEERPVAQSGTLEQALLDRLRAEDFAVSQELLDRATAGLRSPSAYLGRLEFLLRAGRDLEAARLEPPAVLSNEEFRSAWDARWARHLAQRGDWYGVLGRTERRASTHAEEARRRALRVLAHQEHGQRERAKSELREWLGDPALAAEWGTALLVPEIAARRAALVALRSALEGSRPRAPGTPRRR